MTRPIAVRFERVDVVFGSRRREALALLDADADRETIQKRTGALVAVAGADLAVREGEIAVLMGLSGSGKSSLIRCINGLNPVSRGRILVTIDGETIDVGAGRPADLRRLRGTGVAMVFQQFALLPWRTVAENVGFGLEVNGVPKREIAAVVRDKLALVGLSDWADAYGHELSGGMQQRVGLARAFAMDAPILLMDEPFSALDPLIRAKLQDELIALQKELRKTIVFVSHDLDEAMKIGDRISILEAGRIVQTGSPEEIALSPATPYVAEFVAHMNPLDVLRARSVMTPLAALATPGARSVAVPAERLVLVLDEAGGLVCATLEGRRAAAIVAADALDEAGADIVLATPDLGLRAALAIRRASGALLAVVEDGRLVGIVGERELYDGVLGTSRGGGDAPQTPRLALSG